MPSTNVEESRHWTDEQLDVLRGVGDSLADDVIGALFRDRSMHDCRAALRALIDHDDPRQALAYADDPHRTVAAFLDATSMLPDWVDTARIRRGQEVFERWGVGISVALFCASLPSAYACANGVRVLGQTARLETDTRRRIMETGQFLIDALHRDGLEPNGKGILAIQRVRLMHAAVRALILAHQAAEPVAPKNSTTAGAVPTGPARWDDAWGHPINQEDLAGTLLSFSYTVVEPLPRLGIDLPPSTQEDYLYVWRAIGELLGLSTEVIPRSTTESTNLVTAIRRRQYGRSRDGVEMTSALVGLLDEMTPTHLFDSVIIDLVRLLAGSEAADILELPESRRHYGWLGRIKVLLRLSTHDVENHAVLRGLADHLGWWVLNGLLDVERQGEHRATFDIPDQLADGWGLHLEPGSDGTVPNPEPR